MWRDENDDEFGYSIAEKSKLKSTVSQKKLHIKFDNSDESGDESYNLKANKIKSGFEKKFASLHSKEEKKKHFDTQDENWDRFSYLKGKNVNANVHKSKSPNASFEENKKHITFGHVGDDESDENDIDSHSGSEHDNSGNKASDNDSENSEDDSENSEKDLENSDIEDEVADYSNMTMEELLKLQEKIGTKAFNKKVLKVEKSEAKTEITKSYKRLNKNRPSEKPLMRRTAPRLKAVVPGKKTKETIKRDPRFDDLSGKLDMNLWDKRYSFLKEARKKEMEILRKQYHLVKKDTKKKELKLALQRMENQERESKRREQEQSIKRLERSNQKEAFREGRKPKFMSNKTKKTLLKTKHFEELKSSNKVDKYLERKEKRQLQRERKRDM